MIDIDNYLRINVVDMMMVLISTLLIVFIARKYFWSALKDYLAKRKEYIEGQIMEAQSRNEESHSLYQESQSELKKVRLQAGEMMQSAQADAAREAALILDAAKKKSEGMLDRARADIDRERLEAAEGMKDQMGILAMAAAEQILEKEVDENVHRRYVEEFIEKAGEKLWNA